MYVAGFVFVLIKIVIYYKCLSMCVCVSIIILRALLFITPFGRYMTRISPGRLQPPGFLYNDAFNSI